MIFKTEAETHSVNKSRYETIFKLQVLESGLLFLKSEEIYLITANIYFNSALLH